MFVILLAALAGEEDFLNAYDAYADGIFRFAVVKTSNPETAKDLTQETFIKTWDYIRQGKSIKNYKAFVFKTMNNLIIDFYRRHRSLSLETLAEEGFEFEGKESLLDGIEARAILDQIKKLESEDKEIIMLRYVEELSPREIAEILSVSENLVSVRIHRAIKKARELFKTND